jgi:hypothetical protein
MGAFRFFYNKSVEFYHQNKGKVNLKTLRQNLINESAMEQSDWKWAKDVPYDIKDDALRDFMKAVNANKAKAAKAKKDGKKSTLFEMKFKSKKKRQQLYCNSKEALGACHRQICISESNQKQRKDSRTFANRLKTSQREWRILLKTSSYKSNRG